MARVKAFGKEKLFRNHSEAVRRLFIQVAFQSRLMADCESGVWLNIGECFMHVNSATSANAIRLFDAQLASLLRGFHKGTLNVKVKQKKLVITF